MSRTYILNLLFLINYMCKVSQFCNVGSHAQQMCHTPSLMDIYIGKVGENLHTSSPLILKSTSYLEDEFQPHVGRTKRIFLLLGFRRSLTSVDFGQRLVQTSWKLVGGSIFEGRTTWHKNRGQRVDRFAVALTFSLLPLRWLFRTTLTFVELTWVDSSTGWRVVVTHAGPADQRRLCWLSILLTAETNTYIFLVSDLSSVRSAYMFYMHFAYLIVWLLWEKWNCS